MEMLEEAQLQMHLEAAVAAKAPQELVEVLAQRV
jgi:hypothetical protein